MANGKQHAVDSLRYAACGELYEILHPETAHGGDRRASRQIGDSNDRFTADTAERTGRSDRASAAAYPPFTANGVP